MASGPTIVSPARSSVSRIFMNALLLSGAVFYVTGESILTKYIDISIPHMERRNNSFALRGTLSKLTLYGITLF
jgi:hypothetical protein